MCKTFKKKICQYLVRLKLEDLKMQIRELELWQEVDDKQAEKISGGSHLPEGEIAWSIGFADVVRPSSSQAPGTIAPPSGKIRGTLLF
jgi:hypothetical protein